MAHDLTADDLLLLRSLPISVVAAAAVVEVADGNCSMGELTAGIRGILEADGAVANVLIVASIQAYKQGGAGEAELLAICQSPPPNLHRSMLDHCRQAAIRFADRPDDWSGLARWLRDLATGVVEASTAGGLLGIGGERVTRVESDLLTELAQALDSAGR